MGDLQLSRVPGSTSRGLNLLLHILFYVLIPSKICDNFNVLGKRQANIAAFFHAAYQLHDFIFNLRSVVLSIKSYKQIHAT